ncbi:hypothetical protein [Paenibacillus curdlanolyticus]|nr:hypothetical protein [Paenibacillus curdlanolyticus]
MTEPIAVMSESLFAHMQQEAFIFLHTIDDAVSAEAMATAVYGNAVLESNLIEHKSAADNGDGRVSAAMKKA